MLSFLARGGREMNRYSYGSVTEPVGISAFGFRTLRTGKTQSLHLLSTLDVHHPSRQAAQLYRIGNTEVQWMHERTI